MMMHFKQSTLKTSLFVLLGVLLLFVFVADTQCKKTVDEIPLVHVYIDVSLNDPNFVDLNAVGGWVYITGGVKGIIIYRKSMTEFVSYERNCPYTPNASCARVVVQQDNVTAKDSCCGSLFSIVNAGAVTQGPSTRPLKQYSTTLNGYMLHIEN